MLNAYMYPLGDDPVPNLLVDNDSDGPWVDVEHCSSPAMIVLVRHAFVDGTVNDNVHDVSDLVSCQGLRDVDGAMLLEALLEFISGFTLKTVAVGHGFN